MEKEYRNLKVKLKEAEHCKHELEKKLECFDALQQRIIELESTDETMLKLNEQLCQLHNENTVLRDRNDELASQIEAMTPFRRDGGGCAKRRDKSPDWSEVRSYLRIGKVRRCSTENDLFTATTSNHNLSQAKKPETSESGLETDIETITGSSPTLSNPSIENGLDETEAGEKMRFYFCHSDHQVDRYKMKEWEDSKFDVSDDDETFPSTSIVTIKTEATQATSQSTSNVSEPLSYHSVNGGVENVATQTEDLVGAGEVGSPNFNDGIEWDSDEKISCTPPLPIDFKPFEPVNKFNFHCDSSNPNNLTNDCVNSPKQMSAPPNDISSIRDENKSLMEKCASYEESLELLKMEYEKTETYWSAKLSEEREIFREYKLQCDENFKELDRKIKEYDDLYFIDCRKSKLPTIDEKDYLEKQFTDLEEEFEVYKIKAEEDLIVKESEIQNLVKELSTLQTLSHTKSFRDIEVQTEKYASLFSSEDDSSDSEVLSNSGNRVTEPELLCKCHRKLTRKVRKKRKLKERLAVECRALELHKIQLLDEISSLKASSEVWTAITHKVLYQESVISDLQSSLQKHQKEAESTLRRVYERHKEDLKSVQKTLDSSREKLAEQSDITKQQIRRWNERKEIFKEHLLRQQVVTQRKLFGEISGCGEIGQESLH